VGAPWAQSFHGPLQVLPLNDGSVSGQPLGTRRGYEELTKEILLTGDTFTATTTYDFFDAAGNKTATGWPHQRKATRFE